MNLHKLFQSLIWGVAFIVVGFVWLLDSLGIIQVEIGKWWPLVFVFIGFNIIIDGILKSTDKRDKRD